MLALQSRAAGAGCATDPRGLRRHRRAAERRQVDARQRHRRRQGGDRLRQAADDPPRDPRRGHRAATGSSSSPTCPACSARATSSPSACSAGSSASSTRPTPPCSSSTPIQGVGPGDRFLADLLAALVGPRLRRREQDRPVRKRARCREALTGGRGARGGGGDLPRLGPDAAAGVEPARRRPRRARCPRAPSTSRPTDHTDQPERRSVLAELVREQVLARTRQEVPHAIEVEIDEVELERRPGSTCARSLWTETESPEGHPHRRGRPDGPVDRAPRPARRSSGDLGRKVHLDLSVRVRRGWRGDDRLLDRLGIDRLATDSRRPRSAAAHEMTIRVAGSLPQPIFRRNGETFSDP